MFFIWINIKNNIQLAIDVESIYTEYILGTVYYARYLFTAIPTIRVIIRAILPMPNSIHS